MQVHFHPNKLLMIISFESTPSQHPKTHTYNIKFVSFIENKCTSSFSNSTI
ncbi:hypothetical protein Hanom_Chr04g00315111 [Helianthus anomalus]